MSFLSGYTVFRASLMIQLRLTIAMPPYRLNIEIRIIGKWNTQPDAQSLPYKVSKNKIGDPLWFLQSSTK